MKPFFFKNADKQLFGVYHPSKFSQTQLEGVLLCYPFGLEYMRTHWAFRQLAQKLTQIGYATLRFDYYGTGDSMGEDGTIEQWTTDVHAAIHQLVNNSHSNTISMIGCRLGAALAVQALIEGTRVKKLVLWDPIINGKRYINELSNMHQKKLKEISSRYPYTREEITSAETQELLGYPFPTQLRHSIEKIDLCNASFHGSEQTLLIVSEQREEYLMLQNHISKTAQNATLIHLSDPSSSWKNLRHSDNQLLSNKTLTTIVEALKQ
ncbi:MAG: alpha/beta hydrolase [Chlamydiota bacterium]|nr:alpha/beta hydrolase [Chlamydiota bacterium]